MNEKADNPGARCPKCHCGHCPVIPPTRYSGRWTIRRRQCRHCGKQFRTREELQPPQTPPPAADFSSEK